MKYKYEFEADDSFEKGCCDDCPFSYTDYGYEDYGCSCVFFVRYDECPLEEVED